MVLTEALVSGVPVIAPDAPGARELVVDGENGRLPDADSTPDQFAIVVAQAAISPAEREPWAQNARKSIAAFGRRRCAQKLISLYANAIDTKLEDGGCKAGHLAP
jgi:1,2-diacylglycerol 3-alpha-glucosyltransferase